MNTQRAADGGVLAAWAGWVISHIEQINGLLQTVLLLLSIAAAIVALIARRNK